MTALFAPLQGTCDQLISALATDARNRNLVPCLYKINARTACVSRTRGWHVTHIADEAVLLPQSYDTTTAAARSLRRKMRAAQKAGVIIQSPQIVPWAEMASIDAHWQTSHGTARGGTMGRFCPDYLSQQQMFFAYQHGELIAFISLHISSEEWCLDLMRHGPQCPDGTMHSLVNHAVLTAKQAGIPRLSLAATPACPDPSSAGMRWLAQQVVKRAGGPGLRQFKSAFSPVWQPLYAASPTKIGMALSLADIARSVLNPAPLATTTLPNIHNEDEYYDVASYKVA